MGCISETGPHYLVQAGLELQSSCLGFLSSEMTSVCHLVRHKQFKRDFRFWKRVFFGICFHFSFSWIVVLLVGRGSRFCLLDYRILFSEMSYNLSRKIKNVKEPLKGYLLNYSNQNRKIYFYIKRFAFVIKDCCLPQGNWLLLPLKLMRLPGGFVLAFFGYVPCFWATGFSGLGERSPGSHCHPVVLWHVHGF